MSSVSIDKSCESNDISWLYSKSSQATRDAAYALVAEVFKAENEVINIALLLTLESSGHVFFEKVAKQVQEIGETKNLKYFSNSHLEVEMAHALFEEEMERVLFSRKIPLNIRRDALKMIDRCYEAFNKMFNGLVIVCEQRLELAKQRKQHDSQSMDV